MSHRNFLVRQLGNSIKLNHFFQAAITLYSKLEFATNLTLPVFSIVLKKSDIDLGFLKCIPPLFALRVSVLILTNYGVNSV